MVCWIYFEIVPYFSKGAHGVCHSRPTSSADPLYWPVDRWPTMLELDFSEEFSFILDESALSVFQQTG